MPLTIEEFKTYFELMIEVGGVAGGFGYWAYRVDVLRSLYRVARGRANSADETLALEAIRDNGGVADQAVRAMANHLARHNHSREAENLSQLRENARRSEARSPSPGQMV